MAGIFGIGATLAHAVTTGDVFSEPLRQHRDLPNDILASDGTCTITARAVNGEDEVASPGGCAEGAAGRHRPRIGHRLH